jgi:hypothetical protein
LAACRFCHSAITVTNGRRAEYEHLGYICRTDADTTLERVWLRGERWVWLTDDDTEYLDTPPVLSDYFAGAAGKHYLVADALISAGVCGPVERPVITRAQIEMAARRIGAFSGREFQRHLDVPLAYQMFTDAGFSVERGDQS